MWIGRREIWDDIEYKEEKQQNYHLWLRDRYYESSNGATKQPRTAYHSLVLFNDSFALAFTDGTYKAEKKMTLSIRKYCT